MYEDVYISELRGQAAVAFRAACPQKHQPLSHNLRYPWQLYGCMSPLKASQQQILAGALQQVTNEFAIDQACRHVNEVQGCTKGS